jgi:hypothetical protein
MKPAVYLKPKSNNDRKEECRAISLMSTDAKALSEVPANRFQQCIKKLYTMTNGIYSRYERLVLHLKINKCNLSPQQAK